MLRARSLAAMMWPRRSRWKTPIRGLSSRAVTGRVPRFGADQRLPDPDELPDMGQQPRDHRDPRRPPAIRVDGVAEGPGDVGAVRPVEARVHRVLLAGPGQRLVVGRRGLQLLGRVQVSDVRRTTVGQLPEARHPFVGGVVVLEVLALQVFAALPPAVDPDEVSLDVVLRAFADHEVIARDAAGLVDQGRGGRPAGIVEHGVVQRRQDVLERVLVAHDDSASMTPFRSTIRSMAPCSEPLATLVSDHATCGRPRAGPHRAGPARARAAE